MNRSETLEAAKQIVCADREAQYGAPEDNFGLIGSLWQEYLKASCVGGERDVCLDREDVANMMMILLKAARAGTAVNPKADNWIDIAGYAACAAEMAAGDCPNCGYIEERDPMKADGFCPNCGAKMDLEE